MEKEALLRIAAACPKVVIDFPQSISGGESNTETVIALGSAAATWTMHDSDRDNGVFSPFGLFCSNLKGVTVRAFSETAFGRLFTLPKNKLRHVFVMFLGVSEISSVLNVLTEKVNSSESFFCAGDSMSVELLRGFVLSQKELKIVCFYGNDWCSCQSYRYHPGHYRGRAQKDMGLQWTSIVSACIENCSLEKISCESCYESDRQTVHVYTFPAARGRDVSISICGRKVQ